MALAPNVADDFTRTPSGAFERTQSGSAFERASSVDSSRFPKGDDLPSLTESVIFNVGVLGCAYVNGKDKNDTQESEVMLRVLCEGFVTQTAQHTLTPRTEAQCVRQGFEWGGYDPRKAQAGYTFVVHKDKIEEASLVVTVTQGEHKAEKVVPVRSLKYTGARFFTETYTCGGLTGPDKNTMKVPTVSCAFELVSFGDGRIVNDRTNPKFDALAPADRSDNIFA